MGNVLNHIYILATIFFTVYSQIVMRWQVSLVGDLPEGLYSKIYFIFELLIKPWVVSALISTFFAGVSWMMALTKFEISYAFPFVSLNYLIIIYAGHFLFGEQIGAAKLLGTVLIVIGLAFAAKG